MTGMAMYDWISLHTRPSRQRRSTTSFACERTVSPPSAGSWYRCSATPPSTAASALRPGYQALLEGAREAAFDVVVAEAPDRLSRDQEDVAALFKRLRFAGIRIVTLAEDEISELHVGLNGTMNALFLEDLADKTRRGLRGRVKAGRSGGGWRWARCRDYCRPRPCRRG
jgi:DNA invertase Pin-like site-specific DNA recombinase